MVFTRDYCGRLSSFSGSQIRRFSVFYNLVRRLGSVIAPKMLGIVLRFFTDIFRPIQSEQLDNVPGIKVVESRGSRVED